MGQKVLFHHGVVRDFVVRDLRSKHLVIPQDIGILNSVGPNFSRCLRGKDLLNLH